MSRYLTVEHCAECRNMEKGKSRGVYDMPFCKSRHNGKPGDDWRPSRELPCHIVPTRTMGGLINVAILDDGIPDWCPLPVMDSDSGRAG